MENIFKTWWKARKIVGFPKIKFKFTYCKFWGILRPDNKIFSIKSTDLWWEDKDGIPIFRFQPQLSIFILNLFQIYFEIYLDEQLWEQILWSLYYVDENDGVDVLTQREWQRASYTWPWREFSTERNEKISTWKDKF